MMNEKKQKVVPSKLSREAYNALENIVGKEWVTEDRAMIEAYVGGCIDPVAAIALARKSAAHRPAAVVLPASTEEVTSIVKVANRYGFPIMAISNMQMVTTATVPGTVFINMVRMNRILEIDEKNMLITIQPFVDYGMIHQEASKKGLWLGGSGWHGAIARPCSQYTTAGLWQSDLKHGGLGKNTTGFTLVQADGSVVKVGSAAVAGTGKYSFSERFPGPNIMGYIKGSMGGRGIITEITLKLHPWPGGYPFPEDRGRPSIEHYFQEAEDRKFDRPPLPARLKICWFEYPDLDSLVEGLRRMASSGIGVGLNGSTWYNSLMCSYTYAEAIERKKEDFFGLTGYIALLGVSSERQLAYEEKVLRQILDETGGKLLGPEYKAQLLDPLSIWNIEFIMNTETGMRTVRSNYMGTVFAMYGPFTEIVESCKQWKDTLEVVGASGREWGTDIFSNGGKESPYMYIGDRGHQITCELDQFPSRTSVEEVTMMLQSLIYEWFAWMGREYAAGSGLDPGAALENVSPEYGPDMYLFHRKIQQVIDPKGVMAPGRVATTSEEFKATYTKPNRGVQLTLALRERAGLPKLELAPEGDRWKTTE